MSKNETARSKSITAETLPTEGTPKSKRPGTSSRATSGKEATKDLAEFDMRKHIYFEFFCFLDQDHNGMISIDELVQAIRLASSSEEEAEYFRSFDGNDDGALDFDEFVDFCEQTFHNAEVGNEYAQSMITGVIEHLKRNREALATLWTNYAASIDTFALRVIPLTYALLLAYVANLSAKDFSAWDSIVNSLLTIGGGNVFLIVVYVPWVFLIFTFLVFHTITSKVQKNLQGGRSFLHVREGTEPLSSSQERQTAEALGPAPSLPRNEESGRATSSPRSASEISVTVI
jgi:hypothetical protein